MPTHHAYLDLDGFKGLSLMPAQTIDELDAEWLGEQLKYWSRWIDAKLSKRYAAPFDEEHPPEAVTGWLARLVTVRCYLRLGVRHTDEQFQVVRDDFEEAKGEITEAANAVDGLFDLPLRSNTTASGIAKGGPRSYSEQSPYVGFDRQRRAASDEDRNGEGTRG